MYRHYIMTNEKDFVTDGWSTGAKSGIGMTENAILITDEGDYEFALLGVTNPDLKTDDGIYVYRWTGKAVEKRKDSEIKAERKERDAEKKEQEKQSKISELKHKLAETDYTIIKIAEGAATREEYADVIAERAKWREEINKLES